MRIAGWTPILAVLALSSLAYGQPVLRDAAFSLYAPVKDPAMIAFGPDAALCAKQLNNNLVWCIAPSAPTLTAIPAAPGYATISWTASTSGFVLQETLILTSPAWANSPSGATNPVTVPAALPGKFYRLYKP